MKPKTPKSLRKSIMMHYRRARIGEKWIKIATDIVKIGLLLILVVPYLPLVGIILIGIIVSYYTVGYIDAKWELSKAELEADYKFYNPVIEIMEKIFDRKLKELLDCILFEKEISFQKDYTDG